MQLILQFKQTASDLKLRPFFTLDSRLAQKKYHTYLDEGKESKCSQYFFRPLTLNEHISEILSLPQKSEINLKTFPRRVFTLNICIRSVVINAYQKIGLG